MRPRVERDEAEDAADAAADERHVDREDEVEEDALLQPAHVERDQPRAPDERPTSGASAW